MESDRPFAHRRSASDAVQSNTAKFLSDEDEDEEDGGGTILEQTGFLYKWTNYIHGWQPRYFHLSEGTLSYYKSETDTAFGCRGAIKLDKAIISVNNRHFIDQPTVAINSVQSQLTLYFSHEFDECRFEICVNDCNWYLRAETKEDRQKWMDTLEAYKVESGYGSTTDLRRHGSMVSLASQSNRSLTSTSSFKSTRGLAEKLAELETFRDIVVRQVDTLQGYFDHCASTSADTTMDADEYQSLDGSQDTPRRSSDLKELPIPDFKGEALTFKATTSGILATVEHCIDLMQQREETWKRKLEKETERRRRAEEACKLAHGELSKHSGVAKTLGGPDFEEGPNSALNEEEWHDAVDAALDREDQEQDRIRRLLSARAVDSSESLSRGSGVTLTRDHRLFNVVERTTVEQLQYALAGVEEGVWSLFAEDGEMRMFRREEEREGMVVDPLKAVHSVRGVTAREYCHYFFEAEYKLDWDLTLEHMAVTERISDDTLVIHQVHKKIWPTAQRESLFWSHMRRSNAGMDRDAFDCWVVSNQDTEHEDAPLGKGNLRVGLTVAMVCQTIIDGPVPEDLGELRRDQLTCRIVYVAQVNPGGWAPASALRVVYRREYPKFLKCFTAYVLDKTSKKKGILL